MTTLWQTYDTAALRDEGWENWQFQALATVRAERVRARMGDAKMINAIRDLQLFTSIFTKFFCGESTSTFIRFLDWPEGIIFRACNYGESGTALKERILGPKINNAEKSDYFDKMETSPNTSLWMWEEVIIVTDGSGDKPVPTLDSVSGPLAGTMMVHTRLFVLNNNREERGVFTRNFLSLFVIVEHMS